MSPTDRIRPDSFFAEVLLPLRYANLRRRVSYLQREVGAAGNWCPVVSRTGGLERLSAENAGAAAMIERLGRHWELEGDPHLPKLVPLLQDLRRELFETRPAYANTEPELPEFVYTMF